MRAKVRAVAWLLAVVFSTLRADTDDASPELSLDFLEFLADWQDQDGELIDPLMFEPENNARTDSDPAAGASHD